MAWRPASVMLSQIVSPSSFQLAVPSDGSVRTTRPAFSRAPDDELQRTVDTTLASDKLTP